MADRARDRRIYLTANSPGEVAGWVLPLVEKLKEKDPSVAITLVITPCQYASGFEAEVAATISGLDEVVRVGRLVKDIVLRRRLPSGPGSLVLFLGGDPLYGVLLSKLLRIPVWAHMNKPRRRKHFRKYLVTDDAVRQRFLDAGIESDRVEAVGQLMLDSVRISASREEILRRLTGGSPDIVTFLTGSRPAEVRFLTPFFIEVAETLWRSHPDLHVFFAISPFADQTEIARAVEQGNALLTANEGIRTSSGRRIGTVTGSPHDVMSVSRLVITIPGTNNLQIAAMGVPMLIVTPLNWAEHIVLDGLVGLLTPAIFPISLIKRRIVMSRVPSRGYVSLPNTIAGRQIVPEMIGILKASDVADRAAELLDDSELTGRVAREMQQIFGERGAADRIASSLLRGGRSEPGGAGRHS